MMINREFALSNNTEISLSLILNSCGEQRLVESCLQEK